MEDEDYKPDTQIFPIYLSKHEAERLVEKHLQSEYNEGTRYIWGRSFIEFSADIQNAEGDVDVIVTYSSDDGFALSSGRVLRAIIRPYDTERLEKYIIKKKFELAAKEFDRRRGAEDLLKIMAIHQELFPEVA